MSSTVLSASVSHKAQGRSASGRNGGVRKTTSSNIDCHARFALVFAAIYKFALEGAISCYGKSRQSFSCLRAV